MSCLLFMLLDGHIDKQYPNMGDTSFRSIFMYLFHVEKLVYNTYLSYLLQDMSLRTTRRFLLILLRAVEVNIHAIYSFDYTKSFEDLLFYNDWRNSYLDSTMLAIMQKTLLIEFMDHYRSTYKSVYMMCQICSQNDSETSSAEFIIASTFMEVVYNFMTLICTFLRGYMGLEFFRHTEKNIEDQEKPELGTTDDASRAQDTPGMAKRSTS